MRLIDVIKGSRSFLQENLQRNDRNGCWTDELCRQEFGDWLPSDAQVRWDAFCLFVAEQSVRKFSVEHFAVARVFAAIDELTSVYKDKVKQCKNLSDLHDICDANMLGDNGYLQSLLPRQDDHIEIHNLSDAVIDIWMRAERPEYLFDADELHGNEGRAVYYREG